MKHLLIIGGAARAARAIGQELSDRQIEVHHAYLRDLELKIDNAYAQNMIKNIDLAQIDAIFVRGTIRTDIDFNLPLSFAILCEFLKTARDQFGCKIFDAGMLEAGRIDKFYAAQKLAQARLAQPATQILLTPTSKCRLKFPLALKPPAGSKGKGIFKIKNETELRQHLTEAEFPILAQEWIENDGDYRLLVLGSEIIAQVHRQGTGDLNNLSQGGSGKVVELEAEQKEMALAAAGALGYDFCGVDLIQDQKSGQWLVMEVNRAPEYAKTSEVTGINIRALLANFLAANL